MSEINLTRVVNILRLVHGIPAEVEQTGGGTATLYAGDFVPVAGEDYESRAVVAGPGNYDWTGLEHMAWTEEFFISRTNEEEYFSPADLTSEADIAQVIANMVNGKRGDHAAYTAALDEVDRQITAHEGSPECPAEGPDACDTCETLYSKRANIHTIYGF